MALALEEARLAASSGEAPVGALLLDAGGAILSRGRNAPIARHDPTAHAEVQALREAAARAGNYRLPGSVLVVTLEPCLMCVGALIHARVSGVAFGALDAKAGALTSNMRPETLPFLNHWPWVLGGVLGEDCGELLREFFRERRKSGRGAL